MSRRGWRWHLNFVDPDYEWEAQELAREAQAQTELAKLEQARAEAEEAEAEASRKEAVEAARAAVTAQEEEVGQDGPGGGEVGEQKSVKQKYLVKFFDQNHAELPRRRGQIQ